MTVNEFISTNKLDNSLLMGFYGGGNYGDELLMEVLANLLKNKGVKRATVAYQNPGNYLRLHHDFGYQLADIHNPKSLGLAILRSKRIIVGGGGLWGMDTNRNVLLMSVMLFVARWFMGKKVHLIGVGFYDSATKLGRLAAWFAAKAANTVIARDIESLANFKPIKKHSSRDRDIAWHIDKVDPDVYKDDLKLLEHKLNIKHKTVFITMRRFRDGLGLAMQSAVERFLANNSGKPIIIALLEPKSNDPDGYAQLEAWQKQYGHVQILDFDYNPMALYLFLQKHHDNLVFIGPQFHAILSAHLAGVPYMTLAYDNKVKNLLTQIAPDQKPCDIRSVRALDLQRFINNVPLPGTSDNEAHMGTFNDPQVPGAGKLGRDSEAV